MKLGDLQVGDILISRVNNAFLVMDVCQLDDDPQLKTMILLDLSDAVTFSWDVNKNSEISTLIVVRGVSQLS